MELRFCHNALLLKINVSLASVVYCTYCVVYGRGPILKTQNLVSFVYKNSVIN